MASLFAGTGKKVGKISQRNFEEQVEDILNISKRFFEDGAWLNYKLCHDIFTESVGIDNLLILPLELLGDNQSAYLCKLGDFIGDPAIKSFRDASRDNVRSIAPDLWALQESPTRLAARKCFGAVGLNLPPKLLLHLRGELKDKILEVYKQSNADLAHDIGIDLSRYGYC